VRDIGIIEKFTTESTEILSRQPQTVEEIGEANAKHAQIMKTTPQVTYFVCYTGVRMLIEKTYF
jgi:dynein heavy chain 2